MNGAHYLLKTAVAAGVNVCFSNPGTTEMAVVNAMDETPGMRGVLCLFEGVCTGAADGYARMAGKPALTLTHLGPGFANGVANLHNAKRARTPVVNIIGDHASWHLDADAPLNMDIKSLAGTVSGWQRKIGGPDQAGQDVADAIAASMLGQVASLVFPDDYQRASSVGISDPVSVFGYAKTEVSEIESAVGLLTSGKRVALLLGGRTLLAEGLVQVERIRAMCGCDLLAESFAGRAERGVGLPIVPRVPYLPEDALAALGKYDAFVFVDARKPVAFFGWPGQPSHFVTDDQEIVSIGGNNQDAVAVLTALADALDAPEIVPASNGVLKRPDRASGPLTTATIGATLAALQPENAIIMNEGITAGFAYQSYAVSVPPHTQLGVTGGAIGQGIPAAVGAAIACPDRPVINFQADGSAMYTQQGLWTQAREGLNITTLLCSNRRYKILQGEVARSGITEPGPMTRSLTDLSDPTIGWASIAQGMGVPSVTVERAEDLAAALERGLAEPGPFFVEMVMAE